MFYKHTHLLFLPLSLFSNSQILRSNKQTQNNHVLHHISPPILPISNTIDTTTNRHPSAAHGLSSLTQAARLGSCQLGSCWPGALDWVALAWVALAWSRWPGRAGLVTQPGRAAQAVVRVYFLIFRFPIQSVFILDFVLVFFENLEV